VLPQVCFNSSHERLELSLTDIVRTQNEVKPSDLHKGNRLAQTRGTRICNDFVETFNKTVQRLGFHLHLRLLNDARLLGKAGTG
jgi:hypothetical protein